METNNKIIITFWIIIISIIWGISIYALWNENDYTFQNMWKHFRQENNKVVSTIKNENKNNMWKWINNDWYEWQKDWKGNWMLSWELKEKRKWNWKWMMWWKWEQNPSILINWIALQDLTESEKQMLYYWYSEELMAHNLYNYFYDLYKVESFNNISNSESQHILAVKTLLERYNLALPSNYWILQDTYNSLKVEWEKWLKEALEVGIKIEMMDIEDISKTIKSTDNDDFKIIFTNIWWASYNHLKWFIKTLENNNLTTNIDYSKYLTKEELNEKWWILKSKLYNKLISEWVKLPNEIKNINQR